jgi:glycine/D-amino acid oxidase-like deaminating enzyme
MNETPRSWWLREALALPEFEGGPAPPLRGDTIADVLVVGGGYTGMWTAWFLKEADPGIDVVLVEQDICGGGPSGRNGGFVNGWYDHAEGLVDLFGDEGALRVMAAAAQSVREMRAWCDEQKVDPWFTQAGYIGVASSPRQKGEWAETIATAERLGIGDKYKVLSPEEMADYCRSPVFSGGYHVAEGGTVHPARLARGIRRVLMEKGVRIYEQTPVSAFRSGPPAGARTPGGSITAEHAVLGVNAWASEWKSFKKWIVPRASHMIITAPAPEKLEEIGWTGGESIFDMRAAIRYLRTTPDGRIALGVGGERGTWSSRIGPQFAYSGSGTKHAIAALHRFFPNFADVEIDGAWGGPIDVSGFHMPFVGTMPSGNVHYGFGYTGNGVGPAHLNGKILAALARRVQDENTELPFVGMEPKRFPPEPIRSVGAALANEATVRRDDSLDEGRRPNPLTDVVAKMPRRLGYHLGP